MTSSGKTDEDIAHLARRSLIRTALMSGAAVRVHVHPHVGASGHAVFVEHEQLRIYACTLREDPLPGAGKDPERAVRAWLAQEFPGSLLEGVRVVTHTKEGT